MTMTLYNALIPNFRQILGSMAILIDKAEGYCAEHSLPDADIIDARLVPNMLPFSFQVKCTAEYSIGAIEAVRSGVFTPTLGILPDSFAAARDIVSTADIALAAIDPGEIDSFIGRDMRFELRQTLIPFTADQFLLSFAQPNFYFHATTAYDILRVKGVTLGKMLFLGALRTKD